MLVKTDAGMPRDDELYIVCFIFVSLFEAGRDPLN